MTETHKPRIAGLSPDQLDRLVRRLGRRRTAERIAPQPRDGGPLPLSFAQERLWFLDRLQPASAAYNVAAAVDLAGGLDVGALDAALAAVPERHEALRTTFPSDDGSPRQRVGDSAAAPGPLPLVDLAALPPRHRRQEQDRLERRAARTPFDLAAGPLLRWRLLRLGAHHHCLLLVVHHIVADGWSSGVLMAEVAAGYAARVDGGTARLPELPIQYADYAAWQRRRLTGERLEAELSFWRRELAALPQVLELPTDRPRPPVRSGRGARRPLRLPAGVVTGLRRCAEQRGTTLFVVLLAAAAAWLHRHGAGSDLPLASPVANRELPEVAHLIGFFANTLVLRTDLRGDPAFGALVDRLAPRVADATSHPELPFARLVEELEPVRSPDRPPLAQVMLVLDNDPASLPLPGLEAVVRELDTASAKLDLLLSLRDDGDGGLTGHLEYSTDLFTRSGAERLVRHLELLVDGAALRPDTPLSGLPLLAPAERWQIVGEWNDTAPPAPRSAPTLHALVSDQARRTPEAPAVVHPSGTLSYGELDRRAGVLARRLRAAGVGVGDRVGICLGRRPRLVVALLATLKSGAAYVPLDPAYPQRRVAFMLRDAGATAVITEQASEAALPVADAVPRLWLDDGWEGGGDGPSGALPQVPGTGLAYVIYTSGSTGRPKGVAIAHRSAVERVEWARRHYPDDDRRVVLAVTSVCFDLSVFEIFVPLAGGGRVLLFDDLLAAADAPGAAGATLVNTVPSVMAELLGRGKLPAAARVVNLAGEVLSAGLVSQLHDAGMERVYNLYGPSEDTTYSTGDLCAPGGPPSIGRPLDGTRAHVLDAEGHVVPPAVAGELHLAGEGLAVGYLGRPGLTAERFRPDPFSPRPGGRLYRTGDLVRRCADGRLDFLGRRDHQVKVRGFRIELGEVEAALSAHPAVREAAVSAPATAGGRALRAFVVTTPQGHDDAAAVLRELRGFLAERLPPYLVPSSFVRLEALPRTPNGKLDRGALETAGGEQLRSGHVPPETATEKILARLWSRLLEVEEVGADDDFFTLGGHSLLAARLGSHIAEATGVDLPLVQLFATPRLRDLAAAVDAAGEVAGPALEPRSGDGEPPLSFAQRRLWFLHRMDAGSVAYHMPGVLRLSGALDPAGLEAALTAVESRHEVLRTAFPEVGGEPVQRVAPPGRRRLPGVDLTALPAARREDTALRLLRRAARRPFDLSSGPVWRRLLVRLGEEEHLLAVTLHHVAADGWSLGVLFGELSEFYRAAVQGTAPDVPELAVQYADYTLWQRQRLDDELAASEVAHWRRQLADLPSLELPADRPRPAVQSLRGGRCGGRLPAETTAAVSALAGSRGVTPFMATLAAFAALLHRYSGATDLAVGVPVAGRVRPELEALIGFFANTLVLRVDLGGAPSFAALLGRVRDVTLDALAHQEVPFERLVEELSPRRSLGHSPLFQVLFAFQDAPLPPLRLPALEVQVEELDLATAKFDLSLFLAADGAATELAAEYATDLFDRVRIERLLAHYANLVSAAVEQPRRPVATLPLMSRAEVRQVIEVWNGTAAPRQAGATVLDLVAARAAAHPAATAVVDQDVRLTYGELMRRSAVLAAGLRQRGAGPGAPVALDLPRGADLVVAVLGVLRAGAACLPLDRSYPAQRRRFLLADADAGLLLKSGGGEEDDGDLRIPEVETLELRALDGAALPSGALPAPQPDHLAYLIYTSGSTGRPKGVAMVHRALHNLVVWQNTASTPGGSLRTAQFSPIGFDVSFQEIFSTLAAGGELVIVTEEERRDPTALLRLLTARRVERLFLPFVTLQSLAETVASGEPLPPSLRHVVTAGEQLRVSSAVAALFRQLPDTRLHNQYGPSETHVVSEHILATDVDAWPRLPAIGRPVDNGRLYLLDGSLQPVPPGVAGELWVAGDVLARGYLGRPGRTAAAFRPDPWGTGGRLYRTGDLARWSFGGEIEFLGRRDAQVKVRGFRVEPGEVEAVLTGAPGVAEAAVVVRRGEAGAELVAYVVADTGAAVKDALSTAALRDHVARQLPDYMVPSGFAVLDAMPLTPSGKLDRRALPAPPDGAGGTRPAYAAPESQEEVLLCDLFATLLQVEQVGVNDDFFALGGHSLLATRLVARVREAFTVELPVRRVFEVPTPAGLASLVSAARGAAAPLAPALRRRAADTPAPLSFAQRRMWFLHHFQGADAAYNLPAAVDLEGSLSVAALVASLRALVRRHDELGTAFPEREGRPVRQPAAAPLSLPRADLSALPAASRDAEATRLARGVARRPFDLACGPLLRATLLRLGPRRHRLLLVLHHIVADGWSLRILGRELAHLLAGGDVATLPPLPLTYGDYAAWQREWLQGESLEAELAPWRRRLTAPLPVLELPTDRPRPAVRTYRGELLELPLPDPLAAALTPFARRHRGTRFMVLLTAFSVLLARYSGQRELVVGTPVANRRRPEVQGMVGLLVNTLPLRLRLHDEAGAAALLERVREVTLEAFEHQEVPFERLVEEVLPDRDLSRSPLFQVLFTVREDLELEQAAQELHLTVRELDTGAARFDLSAALAVGEDGVVSSVSYNRDLWDRTSVERIWRHFHQVLMALMEEPERPLADLPMLALRERQQLVLEWNDTHRHHDAPDLLHAMVRRQAERTPERPAVAFRSTRLTYRQLDERANRLARQLRSLGVGPEVRVGVAMERSVDLVVTLLAVLKAGGTYVPVDPEYPRRRVAFIVGDALRFAGALLLTQSHLLREFGDEAPQEVRVLAVDTLEERSAGLPATPPPCAAHPGTAAYAIYTSGSTGRPKGAVNSHGAIRNRLVWMQETFRLEQGDRVLQKTPFSFDVSVWEFFWPLLAGAEVVVAEPGGHLDPSYLVRTVRDEGITTMHFVPSMLQVFLAEPEVESCTSLRRVIASGEALPPDLVRRFHERLGATEAGLYNLYGPTEAAVDVTWTPCADPDPRRVSLGRPLANTRMYVVDRRLRPQPPGVAGELLIGGVQLARGYLGRPALTAERFVPDPFAAAGGGRVYRTGDLGRWLADGEIEYLGRLDHQVKVRGLRIELGEIETALADQPAVREAVVLARGEGAGRRLVAYVVAAADGTGGGMDLDGLRRELARRLPETMVPAQYVEMDELPLTPNGKVDRRALPEPSLAAEGLQFVAPRTRIEQELARIWCGLLGVDRVGVEDDFFQLGGTSLLMMRLRSEVRESLGREVSLVDLFRHPTVGALARHLAQAGEVEREAAESMESAKERARRMKQALRGGRPVQRGDGGEAR